MNIMGFSIQDNLKKINSWLRVSDIMSIFILFLGIAVCTAYIWNIQLQSRREVIYRENSAIDAETATSLVDVKKPFGSKKGKTYTFSWCSGSGNIKQANKIYFGSQEEAEAQGRMMSKLCRR